MSKTLRVRIVHDSSPEDPRDWDGMCEIVPADRWGKSHHEIIADLIVNTPSFMAATHIMEVANPTDVYDEPHDLRLYYSIQNDVSIRDLWLEAVKSDLIVETFYAGDRGYIAHTTPELCKYVGTPWDRAAEAMAGSIETFKQWAEGDVYGFVIEEWTGACACEECDAGEWVETDSCWGFYGSDPFENGMSDHVPEELHDQLREAEVEYKY